MNRKQLIKKIMQKKEFSQLPEKDVKLAFEKFDKGNYGDEEKVKLARGVLHKVFSSFVSKKILSPKDKDVEWILRKHLSTRERLPYYDEVYGRVFEGLGKKIIVIDLGAGINGFSHSYMKKFAKINYVAVEAVGQLVDLMNSYFQKEKINGKAIHMSLFELEKVRKIIKNGSGSHHRRTPKNLKKRFLQGAKIIFLLKTLDSLEMLEKDYSKKLLLEVVPLVERVVVSFATRSFVKRKRFNVKRNWIIGFINENFKIINDFEIGGERYVVFKKR